MKKISKIYEENSKLILASAAVGSAALIGYYTLKKYNSHSYLPPPTWAYDTSFHQPNIPLLHQHTLTRDKMLSEVRYELTTVLGKEDTYYGKLKVEFKLSDKNIDDLFLDF